MNSHAMPDPADLRALLATVQSLPGLDRGQFVPLVAAHGAAGVEAVAAWLEDPDLFSFAMRVIEAAGQHDDEARKVALAALGARPDCGGLIRAQQVKSLVERLEKRAASPKRVTATIVGTDPRAPGYIPPLSIHELALLDRMVAELPEGWRVYVRPHLDGDRPALALLHRQRGAMLWHIREGSWCDVTGERNRYHMRDGKPVIDPVGYVNALRQRLYTDYLPGWAEEIDRDTSRFGVTRAGVYLPDATDDDLHRLGLSGRHEVVVNAEQLRRVAIGQLVPNAHRDVDMEEGWFETLDTRFSEYHPPTMSSIRPTKLQAERISQPLEVGWRGIEGVAGAGKSTVLAWRAASLARQGRRVLLVTYNQTLANYCRALAEGAPDRYLRANLVIQHFHGLCHVIHRHARVAPPLHPGAVRDGHEAIQPSALRPMNDREREHFEKAWPEATLQVLASLDKDDPAFKFDSILVDEAQDFSPEFLKVLESMQAPGGEVVLAFDRAQRLYARNDGVRDFLDMRRIKGLGGTRRLRQRHADIASALGMKQRLPTTKIELDEGMSPIFSNEDAQWVAVGDERAALAAACSVLLDWQGRDGYRTDGTVVLVPSARLGRAVVELLSWFEIESNHIFPDARAPGDLRVRSRRRKACFVPNDQRVKVATIHSYKGWEADDVLIVEPHAGGETSAAALYVALTRPKSRLVVIASDDSFGLRAMFDELPAGPGEDVLEATDTVYRGMARAGPSVGIGALSARLDDGSEPAPPPEQWALE